MRRGVEGIFGKDTLTASGGAWEGNMTCKGMGEGSSVSVSDMYTHTYTCASLGLVAPTRTH